LTKKNTRRTPVASAATVTQPPAAAFRARREEGRRPVGETELCNVEGVGERQAPRALEELREAVAGEADQHGRAGRAQQQDRGHERRRLDADEVARVADAQAQRQRREDREEEQLGPALPRDAGGESAQLQRDSAQADTWSARKAAARRSITST
jgi:hypothetical protein